MIKSAVSGIFAATLFTLATGVTCVAQFSADSPAGFGAGVTKFFGGVTAFTGNADVQLLDTNRQEVARTPMVFSMRDGKLRLEVDLAQVKGRNITPQAVAGFQQAGLDRLVIIMRPDRQRVFLSFPRVRSYVDEALSDADVEATGKSAQVRKTPLGQETLDGHACAKNKQLLLNARGTALLEATTWNAADLKEFPLQIAMPAKDGTTIIRFNKIQMARTDAAQFEPPVGFAKFSNPDALMLSVSLKQSMAQKAAPPRPATKAPAKNASASAGSSAKK